uniref:NmrA-like domain-containing protein n=1 Tax=Lotharella globosa TaxID=91324 RepID=A0A6V3LPG2_9EUKA|mmetsp:Transcript_16348/g.33167  ORF Transcript_16348/g.33167 Transcript_16348/m.33167 type:complete len:353 (+) Transcript_16348:219-1277(+)|eukprot:CAMPEP_0167782578 /NCGR_PEP_ID=MMETSP0111_2-20121227/6596_1 /TAXON_ID=91324 /ORGANISM="Lotharella globosa, Strain CCCM811" /LENGTH=352 /DNA_ID=CAMNT_0007673427 /DNA_START=205 /DNA_END=1263 /DNA_ORIENTATION=-
MGCVQLTGDPEKDPDTVMITSADSPRGLAIAEIVLKMEKYKVKALVADPFSEAAQRLADCGCMVLKGDISRPQSLWLAMRACIAVVCLVDPRDSLGKESSEMNSIVHAVAAKAKEMGVQIFALCTANAIKTDFIEKISDLGFRMARIYRCTTFCYEDFSQRFQYEKDAEGKHRMLLRLNLDKKKTFPITCAKEEAEIIVDAVQDTGKYKKGAIVALEPMNLTIEQYTEILSTATGKDIGYEQIDKATMAKSPLLPNAEVFAKIFEGYSGSVPELKGVNVVKAKVSFKDWAKENSSMFACRTVKRAENQESAKMMDDGLLKQMLMASKGANRELFHTTLESIKRQRSEGKNLR